MINWPNKLVDDLARRRAVPFLGAGISRNSVNGAGEKPKLWEEILKDCVQQIGQNKGLVKSLIGKGRLLDACFVIKEQMGNNWLTYIEGEFNKGFRAADVHRYIYDLDAPICVTANFDKIYDTFATTESNGSVTIKTHDAQDLGRVVRGGPQMRVILKVHGTIDTPHNLVFARDDYSKLLHSNQAYMRVMDALIMTNTFMFLGCGGSDPDVQLLLERHAYTFNISSPHYFVTADKEVAKMKDLFEKNYNPELLVYKSDNGHKELTESLAFLSDVVERRRADLGVTLQW